MTTDIWISPWAALREELRLLREGEVVVPFAPEHTGMRCDMRDAPQAIRHREPWRYGEPWQYLGR